MKLAYFLTLGTFCMMLNSAVVVAELAPAEVPASARDAVAPAPASVCAPGDEVNNKDLTCARPRPADGDCPKNEGYYPHKYADPKKCFKCQDGTTWDQTTWTCIKKN